MTIQQDIGTEEAANSSNVTDLKAQTSEAHAEQKVILLPRKLSDPKLFWVGFLAKYFDIWVPTSPVRLKEDGSPYTFDFYSESRSKLIKIFTPDDMDTIGAYLDLPYAEHILFILDVDIDAGDWECGYCCNCESCTYLETFTQEMGAYLCRRRDTDITYVMGEDDEGEWDEVKPYQR